MLTRRHIRMYEAMRASYDNHIPTPNPMKLTDSGTIEPARDLPEPTTEPVRALGTQTAKAMPMKASPVQVERIALVAHEANRAYCLTLGDDSHKSWPDTPEHIRESVRSGVRSIANGEVRNPRESHEAWLRYKQAEGWTLGPVKDVNAKVHPNLVPYDKLPAAEKLKDAIYRAIVVAMLRGAE